MRQKFETGVRQILLNWTALIICIENKPGKQYIDLLQELITELYFNYSIDVYCLIENLENYMEDEFQVDIQDGSIQQVCSDINLMFSELMNGQENVFKEVMSLKSYVRDTKLVDDEEIEDNEEEIVLIRVAKVKVIDEDGFEMVTRKR